MQQKISFWHYCLFVPEQKSSAPYEALETILCIPEESSQYYRGPRVSRCHTDGVSTHGWKRSQGTLNNFVSRNCETFSVGGGYSANWLRRHTTMSSRLNNKSKKGKSESPRQSHTQFTCFTGTKVQILTQLAELVLRRHKIQKFRAQTNHAARSQGLILLVFRFCRPHTTLARPHTARPLGSVLSSLRPRFKTEPKGLGCEA